MYIELYKYVEGDDNAERGEYLGYVSLEEDDIYIDVDDERLAEKLEDLFSEPVSYSRSSLEPEKEVEPYTEEFFRVAPKILPDYNIRGILKEDEDEEYVKPRRVVEAEDAEEEEDIEEEMTVGMTMEDMSEMEEGYGLDGDDLEESEEDEAEDEEEDY